MSFPQPPHEVHTQVKTLLSESQHNSLYFVAGINHGQCYDLELLSPGSVSTTAGLWVMSDFGKTYFHSHSVQRQILFPSYLLHYLGVDGCAVSDFSGIQSCARR